MSEFHADAQFDRTTIQCLSRLVEGRAERGELVQDNARIGDVEDLESGLELKPSSFHRFV